MNFITKEAVATDRQTGTSGPGSGSVWFWFCAAARPVWKVWPGRLYSTVKGTLRVSTETFTLKTGERDTQTGLSSDASDPLSHDPSLTSKHWLTNHVPPPPLHRPIRTQSFSYLTNQKSSSPPTNQNTVSASLPTNQKACWARLEAGLALTLSLARTGSHVAVTHQSASSITRCDVTGHITACDVTGVSITWRDQIMLGNLETTRGVGFNLAWFFKIKAPIHNVKLRLKVQTEKIKLELKQL